MMLLCVHIYNPKPYYKLNKHFQSTFQANELFD